MSVYISYVGNASDIVDVLNNAGFKAKLQKKTMIADQEIIVPSGLQLINTEAEYDDIIRVINQCDNDDIDIKHLALNQERIIFDIKSKNLRQKFRKLNVAFAEVE